ncbi:MAG TPA: SUMF1/EgtB/PvdO family nonheme iron enzyme [Polyangiaceae bacterium]|nr:SUMF1/EgtB/PvdO family nonheme iron enzyme [Polyangiaceae bacterium]
MLLWWLAEADPPAAPPVPRFLYEVRTLRTPSPLMVRISGGTVVVGSTEAEVIVAAGSCAGEPLAHRCTERTFADEYPRRVRTIGDFWLDRTEVSVAEYNRCVAAGRCEPPHYELAAARFEHPDYPVSFVTWADARAYCGFRGARLPTEIEFERAARGPAGRTYPWGNIYNARVANHGRFAVLEQDESDGFAELAPVGSFVSGATPEGVLDLAGNVAEWQADVYRERYDASPPEDFDAPRVTRGGGFLSGAAWLRGAARDYAHPAARRMDLGFRCARSAGPMADPQKTGLAQVAPLPQTLALSATTAAP